MIAILADPIAKEHEPGSGHPECPARWDAAVRGASGLTSVPAREAAFEELALCHTPAYIARAKRDVESGLRVLSTGDTDLSAGSYAAAIRASGLCLNAVDLVVERKASNAFCIVRPPGHHATADRGMGFCLFNNIAIAARYAQKRYGIGRVLIADWDVHHGNGTQDIFYNDGSVFFFSTHQSPLYPYTGAPEETGDGAGKRMTLNRPVAAGSGRTEILPLYEDLALRMEEFRPELVMISAGFDSRIGDPLGSLRLTDDDFADLTRLLMGVADRCAGGRLVSVLEGGYNLEGLSGAVSAHTQALAGPPSKPVT